MNIDELHNKLAKKDWLIEDLTEVDFLLIAHVKEIMEQQLTIPAVVGRSEQLKCGNNNPPCSPDLKFGVLHCCECEWGE